MNNFQNYQEIIKNALKNKYIKLLLNELKLKSCVFFFYKNKNSKKIF